MKPGSRTEYSAKNTYIGTASRIVAILMGFITRVVFTHMLSESYVGINGLFTDILNVLSLSELGVETAITYALYKPIAENNLEEQKSLMRMYRLYYRIIAVVIFIAGLTLIPFLHILIKNKPDVEHLTLIYLLYLINTFFSYLLIYKKTLIDANQMFYIGMLYQTVFWVIQDILQIIILILTKNFILFLLVYILCTLAGNICISRKADKLYPFLKEKDVKPLEKLSKKQIFKNVRAMFLHKIGTVLVNNTDNLVLSSFVGIISVGCYSNYFLIIKSVGQIVGQMFQGIAASIGNLGATEDISRVRRIFETAVFLAIWLYGLSAIVLYELLNLFVEVSFGEKYLFSIEIVLILCINFFITGIKDAILVFRDALGLFWSDRFIPLLEAGLNLVVSLFLVRKLGTAGVFLGTFISTVSTSIWMEPYLLYKNYLKLPSGSFFLRCFIYIAATGGIWWLTDFLCRTVNGNYIVLFIKRAIISLVIPNTIMCGLYFRTREFRFILEKTRGILKAERGITNDK